MSVAATPNPDEIDLDMEPMPAAANPDEICLDLDDPDDHDDVISVGDAPVHVEPTSCAPAATFDPNAIELDDEDGVSVARVGLPMCGCRCRRAGAAAAPPAPALV